jgi:mono/diheme cytochrome c family protein
MRVAVMTVILTLLVLFLAGAGVLYSGVYNVAATDGHWPVVRWVMEQARIRSIRAHAAGIAAPALLDDPAALRMGVEHFAAHCAVCHGAPGVPKGDIAKGMYPVPPNLVDAARQYSPAELFWIVKNGLKMTGMPSWADHGDGEIWATVAFLQKLPTMTEQDYVRLLQGAMMGGGHDHGATPDGDAHGAHQH